MKRKYVYAFRFARVTKVVSIFERSLDWNEIKKTNDFIHLFSMQNSYGDMRKGSNENYREFWFDCPGGVFDVFNTITMKRVFERMGVELVFEYPFKKEF